MVVKRRPVLHSKRPPSLALQEIELTLAVPARQRHIYRNLYQYYSQTGIFTVNIHLL